MIELSAKQRAACRPLQGPVRIVAGAGTGKTAVIAERYSRIVARGGDPSRILVLTFTDKAASEMRERVLSRCPQADPSAIGTFHSQALGWLREDGREIGVGAGFRLLVGADLWLALRELMWEAADPVLVGQERPDDLVSPLLQLDEKLKQELVQVQRLQAWARDAQDVERGALLGAAARLLEAFAARKRRENQLDFNDLIVRAAQLLATKPEIRERYRQRWRWILVDEYQDTNLAQERVVELLGAPAGNVCVVGDDDQSIYRFRGASRASLERFLAVFPSAATRTLAENRRSAPRVVEAAAALIEHNPDRSEKELRAHSLNGEAGAVQVWRLASRKAEARLIAAEIQRLAEEGAALERIAVLGRTHASLQAVAEELSLAGLPYEQSGQGLFRRPEVLDLIAYLRLIHDSTDLLALVRLLSRPPLNLDLVPALERIRSGAETGQPPLVALSGWQPTSDWALELQGLVLLKSTLGVDDLLFEVLERTRYLQTALPPDGLEAQRVSGNVGLFMERVEEYCERRRDHSLSLFVEHLDLVLLSGEDAPVAELTDTPHGAIQLLTMHRAKGLEFDTVFLPSLVESRVPHRQRPDLLELPAQLVEPAVRGKEDQVAEERRLFYVAMTRARCRLVLTYADRYEGSRLWRQSRFLRELGQGIEKRDLRETAELTQPVEVESESPALPEADCPVLSFSSISAYQECPRRHWFRYQLRLSAQPSVEAQFGTVLHQVLKRAGSHRRQGRELSLELLYSIHEDAWDRIALSEPRRRPVLEALGWRLLETLHRAGGLERAPLLVEEQFNLRLPGWQLQGVIDRVERGPEGIRIVDYKSGRPERGSALQLALYALGAGSIPSLAAELDGEPPELEIVYLRKEAQREPFKATPELLAEASRTGAEVAAGIRLGRFEPRPQRRRCALCAYRLACDAAL
ncbi:MAG: ATP-dependent helicase [Candidatus Dormibacteraeota bacterium]|nr:ATP-dependent helicase [Candidatus Dormibacteraeota bacterium]